MRLKEVKFTEYNIAVPFHGIMVMALNKKLKVIWNLFPPSISTVPISTCLMEINKPDLHLVKRIGSGGFSCVFQAKWKDQDAAAKRLNEPDEHEVEVLAKLDHPNIVKLIGICRDELDLYLVLELCTGGSLRSYLDQQRSLKKKLPLERVLDWAKQAARPIQYLKDMKIVYKDVKSPNYLIAEGNVLKLANFGLAKNIEFTFKNATERASRPWMAPELLVECVLSPTHDIHSYGIVVWELCTTEIPFEGSGANHVVYRICNNERPTIPPDCPQDLTDLMTQCWNKDWRQRPTIDHILNLVSNAIFIYHFKCENKSSYMYLFNQYVEIIM